MPRYTFWKQENAFCGRGVLKLRKDAQGKLQVLRFVRNTAELRTTADGKSFGELDELCEMS